MPSNPDWAYNSCYSAGERPVGTEGGSDPRGVNDQATRPGGAGPGSPVQRWIWGMLARKQEEG